MIQFVLKLAGSTAVVFGVLAIAFGSVWASETMQFFSSTILRPFETFVPFLPILLVAFGAFLVVKSRE